MKDGFLKVAAMVPNIKVADTEHNINECKRLYEEALSEGAKIIVFPELCISGYTCGDLFLQEILIRKSREALVDFASYTEGKDGICFLGLPIMHMGKLYNVAAAVSGGEILGLVPKTYIPNYNEFYEARYFAKGNSETRYVNIGAEDEVLMGTNLLFTCTDMPALKIAAEICEDLWTPNPPSNLHAVSGANVIVNLSASDEITGKDVYRRELVKNQSARLLAAYIYCSAGYGESTSDVVYSGHSIIAENGTVLCEAKRFANESIFTEIDIERLEGERRRMSTFETASDDYDVAEFELKLRKMTLTRYVDPAPFVPAREDERIKRCSEIFLIQSMGLKKRLDHTSAKHAVVGISGGLDSTLALLVTVQAFDLMGLPRENVIAVTMPGFGTTDRTYDNAVGLIKELGAHFEEINISNAVRGHFKDIGHDESIHDVTYENCQARERTQILMDIANKTGGLVIGTGDMSELALGWATYNGDHMSMYGVNAGVPKTLVRHLVRYVADTCGKDKLSKVLYDVLDTPVSPELLPPEEGKISQKTEDIVGPYELHDFFLYNMLRNGFSPKKIYRLAEYAFKGSYDSETILKWLEIFTKRFFAQQFKRSCLPDGPKVGSVAVSPRGDLRMPSDAARSIWMKEIEELKG